MGRRGRRILAGVAVGGLLVVGACGGSGYDYVSNSSEGLHFRVPEGWAVVEVDDGSAGTPQPAGASQDWMRLLDGSPSPSVANYNAAVPVYPVGLAVISAVTTYDERDALDYASLRALATNGTDDPLALAAADDGNVEIVALDDVTDGGMRGERVVFNVTQTDGSVLTVDQTALVNPATTQVYRLLLKCEAHCYEANRDEIDDIVDSWTVEED